ncbi:MAG: flagellar basal-body MS-ring/collar protein FliF [Pseudomonadota bacterium]
MDWFLTLRNAPLSRQLAVIGGLVAVISLVLAAIYFLFLRSDYDPLFRDLGVADATRIVAELEAEQIPYRLVDGGGTIEVAADRIDAARLSVASSDLPLETMVGFELFNESNIGLTEFAQKINYQRALQGELARTVMALNNVEAARIHISMAEQTIFRGDRNPPTASVTLLTRPGHVLPRSAVEGIQRLVAAAVPDLEVGNVVILDQAGRVVSSGLPSAAIASPAMRERQAVEGYYAARIEQALARYRRDADFDVTVRIAEPALSRLGSDQDPALGIVGERDFGLVVRVASALANEPGAADEIRELTAGAIIANAANGDMIDVTVPSGIAEPSGREAPELQSPADARPPAPVSGQSRSMLWPLAGLVVVLLFLFLWLKFRTRRRGRIGQPEIFARRISDLLREEMKDAR